MRDDPDGYSPSSIGRTDRGIVIGWSDGKTTQWTARELRDACPCATCREKHGPKEPATNASADGDSAPGAGSAPRHGLGLPVLSAAEARPLQIEAMRPVGTYAYNIAFSDGHHSGLFTFDQLRKAGVGTRPAAREHE